MELLSKNGHRVCASVAWLAFGEGSLEDRRILIGHTEEDRYLHDHAFLHNLHQVQLGR